MNQPVYLDHHFVIQHNRDSPFDKTNPKVFTFADSELDEKVALSVRQPAIFQDRGANPIPRVENRSPSGEKVSISRRQPARCKSTSGAA